VTMLKRIRTASKDERGAALMMVIVASLLLGTACIALLSAAGASSYNNSDALTEAKAYWAAESGLQATINYLRNTTNMTYAQALANQTGGTLPVTGPVTIGETRYAVVISDPDGASLSTTFGVTGEFLQADGDTWASSRTFGTTPDTTTISYLPVASANYPHPISGTSFGRFSIVSTGAGAAITDLRFRLPYRMTAPRTGTTYLRGWVRSDRSITFDAYTVIFGGSPIRLCQTAGCSPSGSTFALALPAPTLVVQSVEFFGTVAPLDPYRLLVRSSGYGPDGSLKILDAIIQKNILNDFGSNAAITMLGSNAVFQSGPSNNMDILGGGVPSVLVADPTSLNAVQDDPRYANMQPPPEIYDPAALPGWQSSPAAMDDWVRRMRTIAINSGRYFTNGGPSNTQGWGNYAAGTGITFCEGDCDIGNNNGGGTLIVTGRFQSSGNSSFQGLLVITGSGGWNERRGGGSSNGTYTGSVVIAPYNPNNLTAWGTPTYIQAGGSDDTIYEGDLVVDDALNGTRAVTDLIIGIAEK
jgi:hypothetical protein